MVYVLVAVLLTATLLATYGNVAFANPVNAKGLACAETDNRIEQAIEKYLGGEFERVYASDWWKSMAVYVSGDMVYSGANAEEMGIEVDPKDLCVRLTVENIINWFKSHKGR